MWFFFGIFSLVSFSVFFGLKGYRSSWEGTVIKYDGRECVYTSRVRKGKTDAILIGCKGIDHLDLTIKPERWWDRLFKWLGISVEYQVGRDEFDDKFYLMSDQESVCNLIGENFDFQEGIQRILALCQPHGMKLKSIHFRNERIWVECQPLDKKSHESAASLANIYLPELVRLTDILARKLPLSAKKLKDPFVFKASVILAISSGLAVSGLINLFRIVKVNVPFILDVSLLFNKSLVVGSCLIAVLIIFTLLLLGRMARTHLILIELVFIGYFGAVSTSLYVIRDINIEFDQGPPERFIVEILDKKVSKRRRSTSYYFYVEDWLSRNEIRKIEVSSENYYKYSVGEALKIVQKPGFFGIRWVSGIFSHR